MYGAYINLFAVEILCFCCERHKYFFFKSEKGIEGEIENKMTFSLTSHTVGSNDYVHLEFYVQSIPILMKVRYHLKQLLVRII